MLVTAMYNGSGLGNQLANYVSVRCLASDKKLKFGVQYPERFKGLGFMTLNFGELVTGGITEIEGQKPSVLPDGIEYWYKEETSGYDPKFKEIKDNTLVHGWLQGVDYFKHKKNAIRRWLKVDFLDMPDDVCVINFRGGEYKYVPDFFLPKSYFDMAIAKMLEINPNMQFVVHTDDKEEARKFFPDYSIVQDIGVNWRAIRYAKYLILSNSSFAILPAWLNESVHKVIAPWGFGRYNKEYWLLDQNYVEGWDWLHKDGTITN
jgi:hypothetical protein